MNKVTVEKFSEEYYYLSFRQLGTLCELWYKSRDKIPEIEKVFAKLVNNFELKFSRFLNNSLTSRFNDEPLNLQIVLDEEFNHLLNRSLFWIKYTEGIFNPFLLPTLLDIGYTDSWDDNIKSSNRSKKHINTQANYPRAYSEINDFIEYKDDKVTKLKEITLDFGGIGKGYLADIIAKELTKYAADFVVSLGGDMYIHSSENWDIEIEENNKTRDIQLQNQAVATSGTGKRVFAKGDHLIDPRIGKSVKSKYSKVSVVAANAQTADVLAKTLLVNPKFKSDLILQAYYNLVN